MGNVGMARTRPLCEPVLGCAFVPPVQQQRSQLITLAFNGSIETSRCSLLLFHDYQFSLIILRNWPCFALMMLKPSHLHREFLLTTLSWKCLDKGWTESPMALAKILWFRRQLNEQIRGIEEFEFPSSREKGMYVLVCEM